MRPEDDTRSFWIFTPEGCDHPIGVLTKDRRSENRTGAYRQMYGGVKAANEAVDRGVRVDLVDASTYHRDYIERFRKGCTC